MKAAASMIDLLKDLIQIKSDTKSGANDALLFCYDWLKARGEKVEVHNNDGYLMLTASKGHGAEKIIWNGHVDVVPGHQEQFFPIEKGDKLYGRGSADMKAGVAGMMQAFVDLDAAVLPREVHLHIVTDEEIGGFNTSKWLVEQGHYGDFVICGEPTQLKIALQSKGILWLDLTFKGRSAHGSRPWEGINAIELAMKFHAGMGELPFRKQSTEYYEQPSVNLPIIHSGERYNVVPERCRMSYEIRFMPGQDEHEIVRQMEQLAKTLAVPLEIKMNGSSPPLITTDNHPYVQNLMKVVESTLSEQPVLFGQHGAADTRHYAKKTGGQGAIEFGPSGDDWHGDAEYVSISSIYAYKEILIAHANAPIHVSK